MNAPVSHVTVRAVEGRADGTAFIGLPAVLQAADPAFVQPLWMERREALDPRKNPFFQHAETAFWLAERGGRVVGRISAQIDRLAQKPGEPATGHFGLLAAEDDAATVLALLETAKAWLRHRGMARMQGPFNLSINEETGLLVDGFDTPPMLLMPHDPRWLAPLVERAGLRKAQDVIAYLRDTATPFPAPLQAMLAKGLPEDVRLRPLDMKQYRREIGLITDIFNDAWSGNWGFVPFTEAEVDHMAKSLKPLLDTRLVWIAEVKGEAAAFAVCLPNINEAITDLRGRLLPFGWAKLLWRLKVRGVSSGRVPLMGVRKAFAGRSIGSVLAFAVIDRIRREAAGAGLKRLELSWILESNAPMRRILEALGSDPYKTYRIYECAL